MPTQDRTKWIDVKPKERIQFVNNLIVLHPRFRDAVKVFPCGIAPRPLWHRSKTFSRCSKGLGAMPHGKS